MSADKYPNIFSRQIEAVVSIFSPKWTLLAGAHGFLLLVIYPFWGRNLIGVANLQPKPRSAGLMSNPDPPLGETELDLGTRLMEEVKAKRVNFSFKL